MSNSIQFSLQHKGGLAESSGHWNEKETFLPPRHMTIPNFIYCRTMYNSGLSLTVLILFPHLNCIFWAVISYIVNVHYVVAYFVTSEGAGGHLRLRAFRPGDWLPLFTLELDVFLSSDRRECFLAKLHHLIFPKLTTEIAFSGQSLPN